MQNINNQKCFQIPNIFYSIQLDPILQMSTFTPPRGPPVPYNFTEEIPIKYEHRTCTDIFCTIIGILFSVIMIVMGITLFDYDTFVKSNFPTDSDGKLCGVDAAGYNYVYFADAPNFDRRVCVSACPAGTDTKLDCFMTQQVGCKYNSKPGFEVKKYDVFPYDGGRVGYFCFPNDDDMRNQLLANSNIQSRIMFINSLDTIVLSMILSLAISVLFCVLVQCLPKVMNRLVPILSLLVILALSICLFTYYWDAPGKSIIAIVLLVAFIVILFSLIRNRNSVTMNGIFMHHASKMLSSQKCGTFAYIPLFMVFLVGFIFIILMEFRAYWASGNLTFDKSKSLFWEFNSAGPIVLSSFLIVQSIWGLSFLKQAFNFLVSGNVVSWYYSTGDSCVHPFKVLLCKHFGSVVGGSFMTGFFTIGDYLFDLIKPRITQPKDSCYKKCHGSLCKPCKKVFDLVRSDAMGYINVTGNPYCNSARYCQYLSDNSGCLEDSQSASRAYRLGAHMMIAGIVGIICLYVKGMIVPTAILVMLFGSLFISTFFISIHADAAEALCISFIDNQECERRRLGQPTGLYQNTYDNMDMRRKQIADEVKAQINLHPYRRHAEDL